MSQIAHGWCTVVCLVGEGQKRSTRERLVSEWIHLEARFPDWDVYISLRIVRPEYGANGRAGRFLASPRVHADQNLHLAVSMRSLGGGGLRVLIGHIIDNDPEAEVYGRWKQLIPSI